jgi:hypothetical protein
MDNRRLGSGGKKLKRDAFEMGSLLGGWGIMSFPLRLSRFTKDTIESHRMHGSGNIASILRRWQFLFIYFFTKAMNEAHGLFRSENLRFAFRRQLVSPI